MNNFYTYHAFFCCNHREDNKACCQQYDAKSMYSYTKDICRNKKILGVGNIAISQSRCLGRCEYGPVVVIYPDEVWYRWENKADIDEIINSHFLNNQVVKRLKID